MLRRIHTRITNLTRRRVFPTLTIILINSSPTDRICIHGGVLQTGRIKVHSLRRHLPSATDRARILRLVTRLGTSIAIGNVLIRLPLPTRVSRTTIVRTVSPVGSISNFRHRGINNLIRNVSILAPYAPDNYVHLLRRAYNSVDNLRTIIVNHSGVINGPVTALLLRTRYSIDIIRSHDISTPTLYQLTSVMITTINHPNLVSTD